MTEKGCIRGCGILGLFVSVLVASTVVLTLRGCMNEHYRPGGHGDVTFRISPEVDKLVFNAVGEGGSDLYVLELASLKVSAIAKTLDYEVDPCFSPDGKSVVYAAGTPGVRADHIFVRRLDGTGIKQLTTEDANDSSPEFSPDGSHIAFARDKTYNWGGLAANWGGDEVLCMINADGSGLRQITNDDQIANNPHFSADGRTILFTGRAGLFTVPADLRESPTLVTGRRARDAVYSPDRQAIAFVMGQYASDQEIFVCRADGLFVSQVTHMGRKQIASESEGAGCTRPAFTVDGKRMVFFLEIWPNGPTGHGKENLWEIAIDGSSPRKIADYGLFDDPLNWRPSKP
jgi:Tol biopolymer transport system component